ncbi:hypothetical protein CC78DRAFT_532971 [Lojkania enalia]|uniref:Uncharacterized protein n=1 Tax=Lojkania enalia TaxID=147567 RepID=A0A9P4KAG7_9PLEO|nr:hypothetical protein CC78DRAFT_532971 [Didymosphaeria enalia]
MRRAGLLLVLSLMAGVLAHHHEESSSVYTGPMFNPTEAIVFSDTYTLMYSSTSSTIKVISTTSIVHSSSATRTPISSSDVEEPSDNSTPTTPSATSSSELSPTVSAPAQVTSNAAYVKYPEMFGAAAGALVAGLVFV